MVQRIRWDRKSRQKKFKIKRNAQDKQVQEQMNIIESKPELHNFYLKIVSSLKTHGKLARAKAVNTAIRETRKFAEENKIPWRQQE